MSAIREAGGPPPGPHVLHVYRRFHPDYTGDGIYYQRLVPLMEDLGITGEFLAYETEAPGNAATEIVEGQRVTYLSATGLPPGTAGFLLWLWRNLKRFEVVHLHSHVDRLFLGYLLARLRGRKVIYSCTLEDSPTQLAAAYSAKYRPLVLALLRTLDAFIAISPHLLRRSLETTAAASLRFIPQGTDLSAPPPDRQARLAARRRLGLAEEDVLLLNVGSISRRKNLRFLIEALALIPDPALRLVLVGPTLEEDYAAEIAARTRELGLEDRVLMPGFREDPSDHYAAADVFVFASTAEGFPNVLLEAMAAGLPIVTRFLPGLTDFVVEHGRTGFLADTAEEFAAAIRTLRDDPARRAEMGALSRRFAERNLDIRAIAAEYAAFYRELTGRAAPERARPTAYGDFTNRFASALAPGPAVIALEEFDTPADEPPILQVVIDTEAEFDWAKGIWTDVGRVSSIAGLRDCFDLFRRHGVRPVLVVDHPVITNEESAAIIAALAAEGCEVGVHLHAWSTPPIAGPKDDWHSFSGNLGPMFERAKIATLTEAVERRLGRRPTVFKGGRYGNGPNTFETLREAGFEVDLSLCPAYDYSAMGGPNYTRYSARPGWIGGRGGLLSLPTTAGWVGTFERFGGRLGPLLNGRAGRRLRLARLSARADALYPVRLSPEGHDLQTMQRLTRTLLRQGVRIFTLSLHSPSLQVGHTPYTRTAAELERLLADLDGYLAHFRGDLGGRFATASEIRAGLLARHCAGPG
jgi:teichuronic acid biosynthesis glycosyltransferase TuaC